MTFNQVVRGSNPRTLMGMREKQCLLMDAAFFVQQILADPIKVFIKVTKFLKKNNFVVL